MNFLTLKWLGSTDGYLELIDQRLLPAKVEKIQCRTPEQLYDAIKTLAVRGAPAIGVAAAYGLCLAAGQPGSDSTVPEILTHIKKSADLLASSRPTAVNLFHALARMKNSAELFIAGNRNASVEELKKILLTEADLICTEDIRMCSQLGLNGQKFIPDGCTILTHCNAGALATAGIGTALAPVYTAHAAGKNVKVFVDETRPLLQGARLTAWELVNAGIDTTLICDNMAGALMKQGKIDLVITGADRIAANGDTANKTGTYSLAVLAKAHGIPFYIAAPSSTFDIKSKTGKDIPIEHRCGCEITSFGSVSVAPQGVNVYNPAFDVTDASLIKIIITEKGVIENPDAKKIARHLA